MPITIQAITGQQLGQLSVTTFDDVIKMLPNVTFSANGPGQGNIYMRGLSVGFAGSQSSASINPFPNVATYLDEQSLTFPGRNLDVYMVDMDRIETSNLSRAVLFRSGDEGRPKAEVAAFRASELLPCCRCSLGSIPSARRRRASSRFARAALSETSG